MFKVRRKYWFSVFGKAQTGAGSVEDVERFSLLDLHFSVPFQGSSATFEEEGMMGCTTWGIYFSVRGQHFDEEED